MTVEGNVFYDWKLPFCNSFGLSIMAEGGVNTCVIDNYLRALRVGPWNSNLEGQGERFGIGIEAGFDSGEISRNVIGGPFAHFVTTSGQDMLVKNNRFSAGRCGRSRSHRAGRACAARERLLTNTTRKTRSSHMPDPPAAPSASALARPDDRAAPAPNTIPTTTAQIRSRAMKILIVGHACCPGRGSEPGITWNTAWQLAESHDVWVITHPQTQRQTDDYLARHPRPNCT